MAVRASPNQEIGQTRFEHRTLWSTVLTQGTAKATQACGQESMNADRVASLRGSPVGSTRYVAPLS